MSSAVPNGTDVLSSNGRIWCLVTKEQSSDMLEIPARCLSLMRPNMDAAIIPGGDESTREFAEFCREILGLSEDQVVYTDDEHRTFLDHSQKFTDTVKERIQCFLQSKTQPCLLIPFSITPALKDLEGYIRNVPGGLQTITIGEGSEWMAKYGNRGMLHRHVNDLNKPSVVEDIAPDMAIPKGYICSTVQQLLVAFRLLTDGQEGRTVILKPISGSNHASPTLSLSSVEELRFYDFPQGDVILQEQTDMDRAPDGQQVSPSTQYLGKHIVPGQPCEQIIIGSSTYGIRRATLGPEFEAVILDWTNRLVAACAPTGVGSFGFISVDGKPMLTDAAPGSFSMEHFTMLFCNQHAPGAAFVSWNFHPPAWMDVWTLWTRLCDRNIAFLPGKHPPTRRGVFPLIFLKGQTATVIAIGEDDADASALRSQAEGAFRTADLTHNMECVALSESQRHIWCQGPRPEYKRESQRYNLPARAISLIRPGKDVIVLPGLHEPTAEFWEFCKDVFGFNDDQVIFTSGEVFNMDDDMDDSIIAKLRLMIASSGDKWTLVPYGVTANFQRWSSQVADLDVSVFGEELEWVHKYGHKGILHRHIQSLDTPSGIEQIDPTIRVAKGYTCSTVDDLVEAYRLLKCKEVVVKPIYGAAGEGILFLSELEQLKMYDFPMGDVCLEEMLDLDKAPDGLVLSPAMHYNEKSLIGTGLVDQIMIGTTSMGWRKSMAPKVFQKTANRYMQSILSATQPKGPGGAEFLSVKGMPVLSSVYGGVFTRGHAPKLFQAMHAPDQAMYCWERRPPDSLDISTLWKRLKAQGCAFVPGKSTSGVFPLSFTRGKSAMFVAIAKDDIGCMVLHDKTSRMLEERARIPVPIAPMQSQIKFILIKNAEAIYTPDLISARHILVAGREIVGLLDDAAAAAMESVKAGIQTRIIDATGCIVVPGFVDCHVHITGGGGELGPASRTPEGKVDEMIQGGMTTVVGVLGTDCVSRSLENLVVKARALNDEGITAYMWTGAYRLPGPTLTGSVRRDISLIEQCIGAGECAISDHRGSQPDTRIIAETAAECRVGGMLSGKAGVMYCHMGPGNGLLAPLWKCVNETDIPIQTFLPTHMERTEELIEDGAKWCKAGGYVDLTCRTLKAQFALKKYFADDVPLDHVLVSSDSYGSLPTYDEDGKLVRYAAANTKALLQFLWKMYFQELWPLERILPCFTRNPARFLKLKGKGSIALGFDADLLLLDKSMLKLRSVVAKGNLVMTPKWTHAGMFGSSAPPPA